MTKLRKFLNNKNPEQALRATFESPTFEELNAIMGLTGNQQQSLKLQLERAAQIIEHVDRSFRNRIHEYRREDLLLRIRSLAWEAEDAEEEVEYWFLRALYLAIDGHESTLNNIIRTAKGIRSNLRQILNNRPLTPQTQREIDQLCENTPTYRDLIQEDAQRHQFAWEVQHTKVKDIQITNNTTLVQKQLHRKNWTLVIDESGKFKHHHQAEHPHVVGILIPTDSTLPTATIHTTDNKDGAHHGLVLQRLLSEKDISIFGMTMDNVIPIKTTGEQWIDCVSELISWIIRLLPMGNNTTLEVVVEQHAQHSPKEKAGQMKGLILQDLAQHSEQKANQLDLKIRFASKYNVNNVRLGQTLQKHTHPWLAYADVVSNTWAGKDREHSQRWLQESNLLDTSLHSNVTSEHRQILDVYLQRDSRKVLSGNLWDLLLMNSNGNSSIFTYLHARWQKYTAKSEAQWEELMEHTFAHLESKAVYMKKLVLQVEWLQVAHSMKRQQQALGTKELAMFEMIRLATANHKGESLDFNTDIKPFAHKKKQLLDEDSRLCCWMDLYLAVQLTHYYNFQFAYSLSAKWLSIPNSTQVIGLNLQGRIQSTMGQQLAFQRKYQEAIQQFDQAIETFGKLSTPRERRKEQIHTRTYKVIVMIDSGLYQPAEIEQEMIVLLDNCHNMTTFCQQLAQSNDNDSKYIHHALVRYLYMYKPEHLTDSYLRLEPTWKSSHYHPWTWINVYRALLLHEKNLPNTHAWYQQALKGLNFDGIELAIGIAILTIGLQIESPHVDCTVQNIQDKLVIWKRYNLGSTQFRDTIREVLTTNVEPRDWLSKALPFNFH